jgi:succinate dehydrogenase / fumarate reductase membrane anchor subunit
MVKRYTKTPVGAHYGTGDWLLQRLTAVVMAVYTILLAIPMLVHRPNSYEMWKATFSYRWFQIATLLFVAALLYHAWVGMRDILMDYIKPTALRLTAQAAVGLMLLFYLVWTASILWGR